MHTHLSGNNRTALPSAVHICGWLLVVMLLCYFYLYFIEYETFIEYYILYLYKISLYHNIFNLWL